MSTAPRELRDLSFGQRLRLAREQASWGLGELARAVPIHPDSLSDYEKDQTDPGAAVLAALVELLRTDLPWVTADWLLFGEDHLPPLGDGTTGRNVGWTRGGLSPRKRHLAAVPS